MEKDPFRVLEGGAHFGTEKKFDSHEERMKFLREYANAAKEIYEKYKENQEKIQNEEEREKFEQFNLYQQFESDLVLVEIFREKFRKAAVIAFLIKNAKEKGISSEELKELLLHFAMAKVEVNRFVNSLGPLLELAHRRVLEKEKSYHDFLKLNKEKAKLEFLAESPLGPAAIVQEIFEEEKKRAAAHLQKEKTTRGKLLKIAKARDFLRDSDLPKLLEDLELLATLKELSEETGMDLLLYAEELTREKEEEKIPSSKKEVEKRLKEITSQLESLWEKDVVRYKFYQRYLENLIEQDQFGERALEIPSLIKLMNEISRWERRHTETPIGAVLIGPPGTGKSLAIEHYLATHPEHKKKGPPVIIDMSQETTEFILLGGEAIEITDKAATVRMLKEMFEREKVIEKKLESKKITKEEEEKLRSQLESLHTQIEDLINAFQYQYVEDREEIAGIKAGIKKKNINKLAEEAGNELLEEGKRQKFDPETMNRIIQWINGALTKWQAEELGKIMYGNGWRDGIILKALKEGRDIIINEYNNFRLPPDALRQLFQTAYGGKWFFPGTGKEYPVYSRIYLTANAGSSAEKFFYDAAQITAPLASRLPPPIEVELPSQEEELLIVQAKLSDTNKKFLCDKELEAKLHATQALKDVEFSLKYNEKELITYLFKTILPKLRSLVGEAPQDAPSLDLRHIDRFCRDLVNQHTRERTRVSVEEAFIKHFCQPFKANPTAWDAFCKSGIIEEMYKVGLLHQRGTKVHNFLIEVLAKKERIDLTHIDEEARKNALTKIEAELQEYDAALIENLKQMKKEEWSKIIEARERRRVLVLNPYLKEALPISFRKDSPIPEEKAF